MNKGSLNFLTFYIFLGFLLVLAPSSNLYAQDEDDSVEEIFWGDEEEESFDEEFDFSDDEEFEDDMEGLEFDDEEFGDEAYIDMPNEWHRTFLNPRTISIGLRISF